LIRRHFFLFAAFVVLAVMVLTGGYLVLTKKSGAQMAGAGPAGASQGAGAGAGRAGGAGGRSGRGGFGGPTLVSVVTVAPRAFEDTIEVLGVAKGRQSVTLTAATTQLVERVRFTDGQHVAKGAILVELRNTEQDAGTAQAEAQLVEAKRAYDRYAKLGEQGWAAKAQVDQYEAAWRTAQAAVSAAKARQADRTIRAPFAGVVGLSDVAPGALVNPGAPIVTLDDVSVMRVDFQVPERYLAQLHEGQTLLATTDAYPGETITGRIARLDTRVDERTRAITARAEFPNGAGKLKPGMLVRVGVSQGQRTSPAVPETAVSIQGEAAFVYAIHQTGERTMAVQRPVTIGLRQEGFAEINEGVKPGERLVGDGLNKLQPGAQPVRLSRAPPNGGAAGAGGPGARAGGAHRGPGGAAAGGLRTEGDSSPAGARPMRPRPAA